MTGYQDGLAAAFLAELRRDPARAIEGIELTLAAHRGGSSQMWADLVMSLSEDHSRAEPDPGQVWRPCGGPASPVRITRDGQEVRVPRPAPATPDIRRLCGEHAGAMTSGTSLAVQPGDGGPGPCDFPVRGPATAFCDYCGSTEDLEEADDLGSGDVPCGCHGMVVRPCRDTAGCISRRSERFPPSMDRVPLALITAGSEAAQAADVARLVRLAAGQAASDYLELVRQAAEDEEIALAARQDDYALRGIPAGAAGAWDTRGGWHPVNFNWSHWAHTIRGGAHHGHLISGGARWGSAAATAPAAVLAARQAQVAQGGADSAQAAPGSQGGGTVPGGGQGAHAAVWGVPGGAHAGQEGGDIVLQQPQHPDALPNRSPAQAQAARPRRDRYGRRISPRGGLRYTGGKPARKPAHPGISGSDGFHGGAMDTGGPGGGTFET